MTSTTEPMTNGEIARSLERLEKGVSNIVEKIEEYPTMRDMANLENRLRDAENNIKWAWRSVLLALAGVTFNIIVETSRFTS